MIIKPYNTKIKRRKLYPNNQFPVRYDKEGFEAVKKVLGKYKGPRQETTGEREER